jgi:hypothetical protein
VVNQLQKRAKMEASNARPAPHNNSRTASSRTSAASARASAEASAPPRRPHAVEHLRQPVGHPLARQLPRVVHDVTKKGDVPKGAPWLPVSARQCSHICATVVGASDATGMPLNGVDDSEGLSVIPMPQLDRVPRTWPGPWPTTARRFAGSVGTATPRRRLRRRAECAPWGCSRTLRPGTAAQGP